MLATTQRMTTTGPRSGGSRFFASPPCVWQRAPRSRNARPANRLAGRKTASRNFFRTPSKSRLETATQTLGTHQENYVWAYDFASGCAVAPKSGGQNVYITSAGDSVPLTPGSLTMSQIRSLNMDALDGATILRLLGRRTPFGLENINITAAKLALYANQGDAQLAQVRAIGFLAAAGPLLISTIQPRANAPMSLSSAEAASGLTVYRVWGGESGPFGKSWTAIDPRLVPAYRDAAGLPVQNTGRYLTEGTLMDLNVLFKSADPLHGNTGGLPEIVVPNPYLQVNPTKSGPGGF